jgi:hypothetical protein
MCDKYRENEKYAPYEVTDYTIVFSVKSWVW